MAKLIDSKKFIVLEFGNESLLLNSLIHEHCNTSRKLYVVNDDDIVIATRNIDIDIAQELHDKFN